MIKSVAEFLVIQDAIKYCEENDEKNLFIIKEYDRRYHVYDMEVK
tara:strand:- start:304 stop:438 length:135 start_codon:yes stop_codon:yes gene_type:complete